MGVKRVQVNADNAKLGRLGHRLKGGRLRGGVRRGCCLGRVHTCRKKICARRTADVWEKSEKEEKEKEWGHRDSHARGNSLHRG